MGGCIIGGGHRITVLLGMCVNIFSCSLYKFGMNTFSCTLFTGFCQQQGPASLPVMSQAIAANMQVRVLMTDLL